MIPVSQNTLHFWSAVGSIATAIAVVGTLFGLLLRGGRLAARLTQGLVNATRANTAAVAQLTQQIGGVSGDIVTLKGDVGQLSTQTALNSEHIKHNTSLIVKLEKGIRA